MRRRRVPPQPGSWLSCCWPWAAGDMEQIRAAFGPKDPEPAIRRLLERGRRRG